MMDFSNLYSRLLRLYPASFREQYEHSIERQFKDEYRDAQTRGQKAVLGLKAIADLMVSVPREAAREIGQDMKFALRMYRKRPVAAALAIAALAVSIGASTGVFSVLNALLLRALPFRDPDRLVEFRSPQMTAMGGKAAFYEWRDRQQHLEDAATFSASDMNLAVRNGVVRVRVAETSSNFAQLLGVTPAAGRTFAKEEEVHGKTAVAVISHDLWQQIFGADPAAIGAPIILNGASFTLIGVAPPRFDYPGKTSIWVPTAFDFEVIPKRGHFQYQTIGRLKQDASIQQANAVMEAEVKRSAPESLRADEPNRPRVVSLREELSGPVYKAVWVLAGMILLVLVTACANVAHLLLSRILERRDEIAMRSALGASRARIVQQLTTEATMLTITGAALGLVLAYWAAQLASTVAPPVLATQEYRVLDWGVIAFATLLALTTGFIFGVFPAVLMGRVQPANQLVRSQPGMRDSSTKRIRFTLLAFQAVVTLVLLASSITMGRTFLKIIGVDLGFRPESAVTLRVSLQGTKHRSGAAQWKYYSEALERLRSVPGVTEAGAVGYLPLAFNVYMANAFKLDTGQTIESVVTNGATEGYFRAIGTNLLAGRDFGPADGGGSDRVVIVNEAFARKTELGSSVVGRRITAPWSDKPYLIAGVVETSRAFGPSHPGAPMIYWPVREEPSANLTLVARTTGDPERLLAQCRDAVKSLDPQVPLFDVRTLEQRLTEVLARPRFFTTATLFLSAIAFFLAAVGTFGSAAQSVAQRSREIGIRLALGGSHGGVRAMLLRENIAPTLLGSLAGIVIAAACGRYLQHVIDNTQAIEPSSCAVAAGLLLLCALLAAWRATARIMDIQPADSVRTN